MKQYTEEDFTRVSLGTLGGILGVHGALEGEGRDEFTQRVNEVLRDKGERLVPYGTPGRAVSALNSYLAKGVTIKGIFKTPEFYVIIKKR